MLVNPGPPDLRRLSWGAWMGWPWWPVALAAAGFVSATCVQAEETLTVSPAVKDATILETSARLRMGWSEIAFRGNRPKAWDATMSPEFRTTLRVLSGLFEAKLEVGVLSDHFTTFSDSNSDSLRGEVQLGINTGAWSLLAEWKARNVFEPGYDDFIAGLNTYDLRLKNRFTAELFADLPPGLFQASLAGGYVASTPHLFARYFSELELECVQRFSGGFAVMVAPKIELSDYLDFPGGPREEAVFSVRLAPSYTFGGGITLSLEGQATIAASTLESKSGETWALTPIVRLQRAL